jgi:argininosuccinate lyase
MRFPDATSLWGGRFASELDPVILGFTGSLHFDARLVRQDLIASLAHARMLLETGIVSRAQAEPILDGLSAMLQEIEEGALLVEGVDEDVHSWIERTLRARVLRSHASWRRGWTRPRSTTRAGCPATPTFREPSR